MRSGAMLLFGNKNDASIFTTRPARLLCYALYRLNVVPYESYADAMFILYERHKYGTNT